MKPRQILLPLAFASVFGLFARERIQAAAAGEPAALAATVTSLAAANPPLQTGTFPSSWIAGNDCANDPPFQVHAYNEDFFILRQSKCDIFEGPFLCLIFGDEEALLLDTGALGSAPVWNTVQRVIARWLDSTGMSSIPLTVAHTHGHFDHVAGDAQFQGQPNTTFVGAGINQMINFYGFQNYPHDVPSIDLGNRVLDIVGTPGHHPASVTVYDRRTQLMLSGDIVYPGHLFIFSPNDYTIFGESIDRMIDFAMQHPVSHVVGCHIEIGTAPYSLYAYGTQAHPNEHVLQFSPRILVDVKRAYLSQGGVPACELFPEFAIHPVYLCGITWNG